MQLPQNTEIWLRALAIGVPVLSAIVVAVISYRLTRRMANHQRELNKELALYQSGLQTSLNKELESHKRDLTRELDNHRHKLQSDFQTRYSQFQTHYSLLHQKKAEAIEKLFALLARVQNDLQRWVSSDHPLRDQTEDKLYMKAEASLHEMINFFDERRIYFEPGTREAVLIIVQAARMICDEYPNVARTQEAAPELARTIKQHTTVLLERHIHPLMHFLEKRFQELLEAETPTPTSIQKSAASAAPSEGD